MFFSYDEFQAEFRNMLTKSQESTAKLKDSIFSIAPLCFASRRKRPRTLRLPKLGESTQTNPRNVVSSTSAEALCGVDSSDSLDLLMPRPNSRTAQPLLDDAIVHNAACHTRSAESSCHDIDVDIADHHALQVSPINAPQPHLIQNAVAKHHNNESTAENKRARRSDELHPNRTNAAALPSKDAIGSQAVARAWGRASLFTEQPSVSTDRPDLLSQRSTNPTNSHDVAAEAAAHDMLDDVVQHAPSSPWCTPPSASSLDCLGPERSDEPAAPSAEQWGSSLLDWGVPGAVVRAYADAGVASLHPWQQAALHTALHCLPQQPFVFTAPTAAGKTLVAEVLLLRALATSRAHGSRTVVLFLVPFIALAEEKARWLGGVLAPAGLQVSAHAGDRGPGRVIDSDEDVAVCTYERANGICNAMLERGGAAALKGIALIVIDEVHMVADIERGPLLEALLSRLTVAGAPPLVCMSATLPSMLLVAKWLGAVVFATDYRPCRLCVSVVVTKDIDAAVAASIDDCNGSAIVFCGTKRQCETTALGLATALARRPEVVRRGIHSTGDTSKLLLTHTNAPSHGTGLCGVDAMHVLPGMIERHGEPAVARSPLARLVGHETSPIANKENVSSTSADIKLNNLNRRCDDVGASRSRSRSVVHWSRVTRHSPHRGTAPQPTCDAHPVLRPAVIPTTLQPQLIAVRRKALIAQLRILGTEGGESALESAISQGVSWHHAGMCADERASIEDAFRMGTLHVLCATTTLSAGVNLPAASVIFRRPLIAGAPLDPTRFWQAAGRAGRTAGNSANIAKVIIVATSADAAYARRLADSTLPPLKSALLMGEGLRRALIEAVCTGVARDPASLYRVVQSTYAYTCAISEGNSSLVHEAAIVALRWLEQHDLLRWNSDAGHFLPSKLGSAGVAAGMTPQETVLVHGELSAARSAFRLDCELHLVCVLTPVHHTIEPQWSKLYAITSRLPDDARAILEGVGLDEGFMQRALLTKPSMLPSGGSGWTLAQRHRRLYASLLLYDLVRELGVQTVAQSYGLSRGELQSLQRAAHRFACCVAAFASRLAWWGWESLVERMIDKLAYTAPPELAPFLRLPGATVVSARAMRAAGFRSILDVARAPRAMLGPILDTTVPYLPCGGDTLYAQRLAHRIHRSAQLIARADGHTVISQPSQLPATALPAIIPVQWLGAAEALPAALERGGGLVGVAVDCDTWVLYAAVAVPDQAADDWRCEVLALELTHAVTAQVVRDMLASDSTTLVGVDVKGVLIRLAASPASVVLRELRAKLWDVGVAAWLLHGDVGPFTPLPELVTRICPTMAHPPVGEAGPLAFVSIASCALVLQRKAVSALDIVGARTAFERFEMPTIATAARMQSHGMPFDSTRGACAPEAMEMIRQRLRVIEEMVSALAGGVHDLTRPASVAHLLYDVLKLPCVQPAGDTLRKPISHERRGTGKRALNACEDSGSSVPALVREHRHLAFVLHHHAMPLRDASAASPDRRIRCVLHTTAAPTGRMATMSPNLQAVPHAAFGFNIRACFAPNQGSLMVSIDYSQIELRVVAHLSRDPLLCTALRSNGDVLTDVASRLFPSGAAPGNVDVRQAAKSVVYGILYGQGISALAEALCVAHPVAESLRASFFAAHSGVERFIAETKRNARECGYVETVLGRRRYLPDLFGRDPLRRTQAERRAVNTRCQGSAADILKVAMIRADVAAPDGAKLVMCVHDELLFEVHTDVLAAAVSRLRIAMEGVVCLDVPLVVKVRAGPSWGELRPWCPG